MDNNIDTVVGKHNTNKSIYYGFGFRSFMYIFIVGICVGLAAFFLNKSINFTEEERINYSEKSNLNYLVYLKKNDFYDKEYLEKDMAYVANLIDKVKVDFNYDFEEDKKENINFEYNIFGRLSIKDKQGKKVYYEKNYDLLATKTVELRNTLTQNIREGIEIDYGTYNAIANTFRTSYGLETTSDLTVYMVIHKKSNDDSLIVNKDSVMSVTIPLSEKSLEIKMDYNEINQDSQILKDSNRVLVNSRCLIVVIVLAFIAILFLRKIIKYLSILSNRNSKYDAYVGKLLKTYDRLIAETKNLASFKDKEIIKLEKFTELLDIHDNLQLPIMYYNVTKHVKGYFYIMHDNIIYLNIVKDVDLENNSSAKK